LTAVTVITTVEILGEKVGTMRTIYRYELPITYGYKLELPIGHKLLHVAPGREGNYIDLWVDVDRYENNAFKTRVFHVIPTGGEAPTEYADYFGTAVMGDGLVWHVYVEPAEMDWHGPVGGTV